MQTQKSYRITLYREVNHKIRYYKLSLMLNLFGEFIFSKEYGSLKRPKPTRVIEEYYKSYKEAYTHLQSKLQQKYKKGYKECINER
ncbi:molybdenum metabolism regulator [Sulfurimonas hydrogeniphila]|uniref:molybdenum metabolism regulator n=1 Tax=Sulfurimonas hydrogeniphila TaxID=2509341 RepID=UPI00125FC965|nr:molybdenum metabolism regulator [Sulfurimonas hydrogeniphila]